MKHSILAAMIAGTLFAPSVTATTPASFDAPEQHSTNITVGSDDPQDYVEDRLESYISVKEQLIADAGKAHLVRFFSGSAQVSVTKHNPDWAVYRSMAIAEATQKARQSYLKTLNTTVSNQVITEFFTKRGYPAPTAKDFQSQTLFAQLMDKSVGIVNGLLDKQLEELGIDSAQFRAAPPEKQEVMMKNHFEDVTKTKAFGDLSGMFVQKTIEHYDSNGEGTVGVVMTLSLKKRDLLVDLINSKGHVEADPKRANPRNANLKANLVNHPAPFLETGTQLTYDAKGNPMILAYGQHGVVHTSDRTERQFEREAAKGFAEDNAWAALAATYNLSGDFAKESRKRKTDQKTRKTQLIGPGTTQTSTSAFQSSIAQMLQESAKTTASLKNMTGVSVEHKWRKKHPATGHEIVGVVLVWHPKKVRHANLIQSGVTADQMDQKVEQAKPAANTPQTTYESDDRFDLSDF